METTQQAGDSEIAEIPSPIDLTALKELINSAARAVDAARTACWQIQRNDLSPEWINDTHNELFAARLAVQRAILSLPRLIEEKS